MSGAVVYERLVDRGSLHFNNVSCCCSRVAFSARCDGDWSCAFLTDD